VLDAGCAFGFLVEELRTLDVEAWGVDVSEFAISQVQADVSPFCWRGSVTDPLPRHYDLITCIEVLEHLRPEHAELAIANLCQSTDQLLFSSTPSVFSELTHVNVRPVEEWASMFARQDFIRDLDFDASFVS